MGWFLPLLSTAASIGTGIYNAFQGNKANMANIQAQERANLMNVDAQNRANAANITLQRETNALNRQWALEDWNRNAAYNDPKQAMIRLREAGLNPHLVMANGAQSTAPSISTTAQSPKVSPSSVSPVTSHPTPWPDTITPVQGFIDMEAKQAQVDNLQETNRILKQKQVINDLQATGMLTKNARSDFDLAQARELKDLVIERYRVQNAASLASTKATEQSMLMQVKEMDLKQHQFRLSQAKTNAEIANINADLIRKRWEQSNMTPLQKAKAEKELELLEKTGKLMDYDQSLREKGMQMNDPWYTRYWMHIADKIRMQVGPERNTDSIQIDGQTIYRDPKFGR